MRPKQCSLRAPNLRGRGRKENRTLKKRRGEEKRGSPGLGCAAAGRPPPFLRAIRRRQPDITPTHPYVLLAFLPFPYYVLNPLYGKWSAPSDFQWMTEGLSLPPTQIGCDLQPKHAGLPLFVSSFRFLSFSLSLSAGCSRNFA